MDRNKKSKIAIITGGASGIGAAYVKRLFKSGMKGCTIADIDEQGEALAKEMECCYGKGRAHFVKTDLVNAEQFECVFEKTMQKYKKLDLLVNNAGKLKDKAWEEMIDLNITTTVRGNLLGIKYMGKNNGYGGGTIVNTSSIAGLQAFNEFPCYSGAKHFIIGFTRSIGTRFWFDLTGIRFMSICPGVTDTSMIDNAPNWVLDGFPDLEKRAKRQLLNEPCQNVEDVAEGLNEMLNYGDNGSIWVCQGGGPIYDVIIPPIREMKIGC
uniref:Alcohol dehydrogenase n=1 Tax=Dendroctonus ponderosae TaxID=77166 RepID=A0AAR5P481_DENPD